MKTLLKLALMGFVGLALMAPPAVYADDDDDSEGLANCQAKNTKVKDKKDEDDDYYSRSSHSDDEKSAHKAKSEKQDKDLEDLEGQCHADQEAKHAEERKSGGKKVKNKEALGGKSVEQTDDTIKRTETKKDETKKTETKTDDTKKSGEKNFVKKPVRKD